jgi:hypothetical protein
MNMNKNKVTGYVLLGLGILLTAVAIGLLVVYLLKRRTVPVATEGFYQQTSPEDISSQIHFRFQLNEDKPAQYLNLITSSSDLKPSVSEYNDITSNGLYKIVDKKDYGGLNNNPTVYFRLQPVTTVTADAKKYYKFVFSTVAAANTGFILVDGANEKDDSEITVFSLKRLDGSERQLNIHNVKLGDYKNLANNLLNFFSTAITAASPVPTWFTVLLLPTGNKEVIPGDKGITYSNTGGKLVIVNNPSSTLMIEAGKYSKFSPLPRVRDLSGRVLFDKGGYTQGAVIERDTAYPNTHYYLLNIDNGKALTYTVDIQSGNGKLEFMKKDNGNKAQIFGIAQSMNLNIKIKNPSLLFIVPIIESTKARLYPNLDKLNIVTISLGASGHNFKIVNVDKKQLETNSDYLTANSINIRAITPALESQPTAGTTTTTTQPTAGTTTTQPVAGTTTTQPVAGTTTTQPTAGTTTTQPTAGTTTTQPTAGTTTTQPASSASKLSDADLANMDEMEKSTALLNERIAELMKDKQTLQDQLARLEGEGLQISDSDYNSKASNNKLRRVVGGQMDKVADMLEKLKALSAASAAASAAAHGTTDYTQRGGTVKKTDTGVSVSDYEGVLNIFYPQFV